MARDRHGVTTPPPGSGWEAWARFARQLTIPDGVHRPSPFSAVLASSVPIISGVSVVDAGSGAGLVAIAALARGAKQVLALDVDPAALYATNANVSRLLGAEAASRLRLHQADFLELRRFPTDLLLVNPPQKPLSVLAAAEPLLPAARDGGGEDGLDAVRTVLEHARAGELWTTAARVLPIAGLSSPVWSERRLVSHASVPMNPAWKAADASLIDEVNVWGFTRRS